MRSFKLSLIGVVAAAALVACGGGGEPAKLKLTKVVTFGDSVSDGGAYRVGTIAALGGGKFTVNGAGDNTWTEALAILLKLPAQCAAQTGLSPNIPGLQGAAVQNFPNCYNYAQGSSRVVAVGSGPNGVALQQPPYNQVNLGLLADSIQNQMVRHLAKAPTYDAGDVVTINGGGNDFFMQLGAVGAAAGGGAGAVGAGTIAGWSAATLTTVSAGGAAAVTAAGAAAVGGMAAAGTALATATKNLVVGPGATIVIVRNLGDLNATPFGQTFPASTKQLSTAMTTAFNSALAAGLQGVRGVILFDDYARGQSISANPTAAGYSNATGAACGPDFFSQPGDTVGNSIICNASTLIPGDTSKYAFSDSVHPTPFAHLDTAKYVVGLMRSYALNF